MKRFAPAEVEAFGFATPDQLRDWRRREFLDGFGKQGENGHWTYSWNELLILAITRMLVEDGMAMGAAVLLAQLASGRVFAWKASGTAADNPHWKADRDNPRFVVGVPNKKARHKITADYIAPRNFVPGAIFSGFQDGSGVGSSRFVLVVDPQALADDIDDRLWALVLAGYLAPEMG